MEFKQTNNNAGDVANTIAVGGHLIKIDNQCKEHICVRVRFEVGVAIITIKEVENGNHAAHAGGREAD